MLKTALITDRAYLAHVAGRRHPECPERVVALLEMASNLRRSDLHSLAPREATLDEIGLVHRPEYIDTVAQTSALEHFDFDPDTHASRDTYRTALLATGGVLTAVEAVLDGEAQNSFAIVRPPGHHALPDRAMGFCFFNSVAVAAAWLTRIRGLSRVMIVDWDVHHGNGSQDMFYASPDVLYVSTHQYPHYPGTGSLYEIGEGAGAGYTVNVPLPAECGDDEYLRAFDDLILPIGRKFKPEFILVSAGFDGHFRDPLANMRVTEDGFVAMCRRIKELAAECCESRMACALEGGYDLEALVNSTRMVVEELGREADERIAPPRGGDRVIPIIERIAGGVGKFWQLD